ncbi:helix-turn-helix domain-containing protein [Maribellus sediminis]|uniref:helix-turn-helix domain-containing protein n=1 Tax=Maribellus sediminis TaxID=2696285 RepID=UPI001431D5CD|nr:helix-turn-helix transcriptional regulator [Maribellus sediminis]
MKDRIQEYMDHKGINAGELAVKLEVQRSNISHILNGRNKPSAALIEKMLNVFPDLNARWLLTGQGTMVEANNVSQDITPAAHQEHFIPVDKTHTPSETEKSEPIAEKASKTKPGIPYSDDDVNKVVLLFNDGTFTTYRKK